MGYIYVITNIKNNKKYIGQTTKSVKARWKQHLNNAINNRDNFHFHRAIKKYGKENFTVNILGEYNNSILNKMEEFYIWLYSTYLHGYNMTYGGEGKKNKMSEIQRRKNKEINMKNAHKVYWVEKEMWFNSINECSKFTNIDVSSISRCIRGIRLTANGQHFSIEEQTIDNIELNRKLYNPIRKVKCVELNKIFNTMQDGAKYFNDNCRHGYQKIKRAIDNNNVYMGYHWQYVSTGNG